MFLFLSSPRCSLVGKPCTDTLKGTVHYSHSMQGILLLIFGVWTVPSPTSDAVLSLSLFKKTQTKHNRRCMSTRHRVWSSDALGSGAGCGISVTAVSRKSSAFSWERGPPQPDMPSLLRPLHNNPDCERHGGETSIPCITLICSQMHVLKKSLPGTCPLLWKDALFSHAEERSSACE